MRHSLRRSQSVGREQGTPIVATVLGRALDEGVEVRQLAGCGMWITTSSSQAGIAYEVTPWDCECHAG